jgi:hypothetical protein
MAYAVDAGREEADLCDQIWLCIVLILCFMVLRWLESKVWWRSEAKNSVNKVASSGFGGRRSNNKLLLLVRHCDECGEELLLAVGGWPLHPQQGSVNAFHRRITTAPLSSYSMAEERLLQPCVTAADLGRPQVTNNLQALLLLRRLFSFAGVSSHLCSPAAWRLTPARLCVVEQELDLIVCSIFLLRSSVQMLRVGLYFSFSLVPFL